MGDKVIIINGEDYVKVEGLISSIVDYLLDGVSENYIHVSVDEIAQEVVYFLEEKERRNLAAGFRKLYLMRKYQLQMGDQ